jgi:hypothetical protein
MRKLSKKEVEKIVRKHKEQQLIESYVWATDYFVGIIRYDKKGRVIIRKGKVDSVEQDQEINFPEEYLENPNSIKKIGRLEEFINDKLLCQEIYSWVDEGIDYVLQYKNGALFFIDFALMHDEKPDFWDIYNRR